MHQFMLRRYQKKKWWIDLIADVSEDSAILRKCPQFPYNRVFQLHYGK